jgi:hypothetical protein
VQIVRVGDKRIKITVKNTTGWHSATRIPLSDKSVFPDRSRPDPGPGGTLEQEYYWEEDYDGFAEEASPMTPLQ